jgi:DNA-binding transcriptional MerR regulator
MEVLMKTNDIIKLGIDRNFIRECERQGLINPIRIEGKMVVNEKYCPREYSDSDLKIIWHAYLFRKMGLSFSEIKRWRNGENIDIRTSNNDSIEKFESQIKELEAIIRFMKYVRGEGLLPKMPEKMKKANSFTEFINEYMQGIDPSKKRMEFLEHIHSELELRKTPIDKMAVSQLLESEENKKYFDNFHESFFKNNTDSKHIEKTDVVIGGVENLILLKNRNVDCESDESIDEFRKLYN